MQGTTRILGLLSIVVAAGAGLTACSQENTGSTTSGAGDDSAASDDDSSSSNDDSASSDDSGSDDDSAGTDDDDSSGDDDDSTDDTSSSGDDDDSTDDTSSSGDDDDSSGGTGTSGSGTCHGVPLTDRAAELTAQGQSADGAACTGTQVESEGQPIDIYFLMDRTESMTYELTSQPGVRRWEYIQGALEDFMTNPDVGDIRVGLGYFNLDGAQDEELNCTVENFETPAVPIGEPADVADDIMAVMDELSTNLGGKTPTAVALQGAINYASAYHAEHAERQTVVAVITDMYPTMCLEVVDGLEVVSLEPIAEVAAAGYSGDPSIRTFVIGLAANFNLASIARAGGTGEPFLVEDGEDYTEPFVERLRRMSSQAVACNIQIPPIDSAAEEVDPSQVVVTFDYNGETEEIPRVSNAAACETSPHGGWYYTDDDKTLVSLCPCTCANIGSGILTVAAGCTPITILG